MSLARSARGLFLLGLALLLACATPEEVERERKAEKEEQRQRLLQFYPPGTTRSAITAKTFHDEVAVSEVRPAEGWAASPNKYRRELALASEQRTGHSPYRVELVGPVPDGWTLCTYWFYYDENDRLLDAEFGHCGD